MDGQEIIIEITENQKVFFIIANDLWHKVDFFLLEATKQAVAKTLVHSNDQIELSIKLTDDNELHQLNKTFTGKDKPTNVLSFPSYESTEAPLPTYIGDIAVSFERIQEESRIQGKRFKNHYTHLIVHGILHLLGYDHKKEQDAKTMESMEIMILKELDILNPYIN